MSTCICLIGACVNLCMCLLGIQTLPGYGLDMGMVLQQPHLSQTTRSDFATSIDTYICVHIYIYIGIFHRASNGSTAFLPIELR